MSFKHVEEKEIELHYHQLNHRDDRQQLMEMLQMSLSLPFHRSTSQPVWTSTVTAICSGGAHHPLKPHARALSYLCTHTRTHVCTHTHTHTNAHTRTRARTHTHTHTLTHTHTHTPYTPTHPTRTACFKMVAVSSLLLATWRTINGSHRRAPVGLTRKEMAARDKYTRVHLPTQQQRQ